jgi:tRNA (adenine57-N1/adenine58-N1)-methyltransferase
MFYQIVHYDPTYASTLINGLCIVNNFVEVNGENIKNSHTIKNMKKKNEESSSNEPTAKKQKVEHVNNLVKQPNHPLLNGTYNTSNLIREGDLVIVHIRDDDVRPTYLKKGELFNCKFGQFLHNLFIGQNYGSRINLEVKGKTTFVYALRPTPHLWTKSLALRTQILYHADISLIVQLLYLKPGSHVVESGTGSGSLSTTIARCIAPTGKLYTFEYHEQRHIEATEEFERNGLNHVIVTSHCDAVKQGFNHKVQVDPTTGANAVDAVFLDLPKPWKCIGHVNAVLKRGGRFCGFSPCIEQIQKTADALRVWDYVDIHVVEILAKNYENTLQTCLPKPDFSPPPKELPPKQKKQKKQWKPQQKPNPTDKLFVPLSEMRGHTGYLLFATRFYDKVEPRDIMKEKISL